MKAGAKPAASTESVKVAVRCRPMNKKEMGQSKFSEENNLD